MLATCTKCKWQYPENILNPLVTTDGATERICGLCALEITNEIHGIKRKKFDGPIAEHMRLHAKQWRTRHKEYKPTEV